MDQECHRGSARRVWYSIFHEVPVRMLVGAAIIWRPEQGWRIHFWDGSMPRGQLAGKLSYPPCGDLHSLRVRSSHHGCFPWKKWSKREQGRNHIILWTSLARLTPSLLPFEKRSTKELGGHIFKPLLLHWPKRIHLLSLITVESGK